MCSLASLLAMSLCLCCSGPEWGSEVSRCVFPWEWYNDMYWGSTVLLTCWGFDVSSVGCWCHQHDHCPWGGTRQGGGALLCRCCHGNGHWLLEGARRRGKNIVEKIPVLIAVLCLFSSFSVSAPDLLTSLLTVFIKLMYLHYLLFI